jgi:hypothetical protein
MEKKFYLWVSLVVGVPMFRLLEVFSLAHSTSGGSQIDFVRHAALGIIVGVACALTVRLLKLEGRRLSLLPVLAVGYATLLLGFTYPHNLFSMPASFVSSLLMMDMAAWIIAVGGATLIGAATMRPRQTRLVARPAIPRLDRV